MSELAGLITTTASSPFGETVECIEAAVVRQGLKVFARLDHAAGAAAVGLSLPPTVLLLIGDPRGGTPLMQVQREAGVDLPLKILVWEDALGVCQVTYADPLWTVTARAMGPDAEVIAARLAATLASVARAATV